MTARVLAFINRWFLLSDQPLKSDFRPNHCRRCGTSISHPRFTR